MSFSVLKAPKDVLYIFLGDSLDRQLLEERCAQLKVSDRIRIRVKIRLRLRKDSYSQLSTLTLTDPNSFSIWLLSLMSYQAVLGRPEHMSQCKKCFSCSIQGVKLVNLMMMGTGGTNPNSDPSSDVLNPVTRCS